LIIAVFALFAFAVIGLLFDAIITNKGIKAGIAVENNPYVVLIAGPKPTLWQLLAIEGTLRGGLLAFALFTPGPAACPFFWQACMLGVFTAFGIKNYQGYREWSWMFAHPGQLLPVQHSIWAKLLGFWG